MRPKTITISPTAPDADGLCASATYSADETFPNDGALCSGYDQDGLVTASTPAAAGTMAMNGALYTSSTLTYFATERYVCIYSDGNDSGVTFTVTGTNKKGHVIQDVITGPNAIMTSSAIKFLTVTNIAISDAGTGSITVGSLGVGDMGDPQHVAIYSAGDEDDITFTVYGTNRHDQDISEDITGPNTSPVWSAHNFKTVTKVVADGAVGNAVEIGNADQTPEGQLDSQWVPVDRYGGDISVACAVSSDADYTYAIEHTFDDVQSAGFEEDDADVFVHATVTGETTSQDGSYSTPVNAVRVAMTLFAAGSLKFKVVQSPKG